MRFRGSPVRVKDVSLVPAEFYALGLEDWVIIESSSVTGRALQSLSCSPYHISREEVVLSQESPIIFFLQARKHPETQELSNRGHHKPCLHPQKGAAQKKRLPFRGQHSQASIAAVSRNQKGKIP